MVITRILLHEVVVPARPDSVNSPECDKPLHMLAYGGKKGWLAKFDEIPKLIIRIETGDGIVGAGEFYRGVSSQAVMEIAHTLLGLDLSRVNLQDLPVPAGRLYDGFETAMLDIVGKARGFSLSDLLGGRYREKVYCGFWTGHRTVTDATRKAKEARALGFDCIKFKCTRSDPVEEWCYGIHDACGPDFKIILDPNQRFEDLATARRIAERLAAVGNVLCLEDPIARWDLEALALLRRTISIPIALHVALPYAEQGYQHSTDVLRALKLEACDFFNFNGGIYPFKRMAYSAELARRAFWHGSEIDLGILEASYVHKCASSELATLPSDIFGEMVRTDDLIERPLRFEGAYVHVPEGPGLGVEIDLVALERHQINNWSLSS